MAMMNNNMPNQQGYPQYQQYPQGCNGYNNPLQMNPILRGFPQFNNRMIPGKFIQNLNDIVVSEVPQDGSVAFFPMNDFSKIYAKAWTSDGKIQTEEYVLVRADEVKAIENTFETDIMSRLDRIEELLMPKQKRKKDGDSDE